MEADFSGYATKAGLKCSDGRTITPDAFKHQDKMTVPLVWQHGHNDVKNILGHVVLEHRNESHPKGAGVYAYAYFNETDAGKAGKQLVAHKDVNALSIYATQLIEKAKSVIHGAIKEVSLCIGGANPGALIDFIAIQHDGGEIENLEDEAIIFTGLELEHSQPGTTIVVEEKQPITEVSHADDETVQQVYDSMTAEQKDVVHYMVGAALEEGNVEHSEIDPKADPAKQTGGNLEHQEGNDNMSRNVFEQHGAGGQGGATKTLTHAQIATIIEDAQKSGSFKESILSHAAEYGIENIDFLFPDAKTIANSPELVTRRQDWVASFWGGLKKNPFSRIKTLSADLTLDEARAKGYVKATLKKEEWFTLSKRITTPTTIYKKQKLDRDDIIDITDLDVVAWLKAEMRLMLDEEIARAALVGDGREVDDEDKINETNIRPIAFEDEFYAHKITLANTVVGDGLVDAVLQNRKYYRGLGNPNLYTTEDLLSEMLLAKDGFQRRIYNSIADLATALRVNSIVTVPVMENTTTETGELIMILVNPQDYTIGADAGGAVSMFDDFDIDYNQYKYLIETRCSGALTKFKSALVISRSDQAGVDVPVTPGAVTFVDGTGVATVPATAHVVYKNADTGATLASGAQTAIASGATLNVIATPAVGYVIEHGADDEWSFTRS